MPDNEDRSLIPLADGSLANTVAGVKRIVSAMVGETLALTRQEQPPNLARSSLIDQPYDALIPPERKSEIIDAFFLEFGKGTETPENVAALLLRLEPKAPQFSQSLWFVAKGCGAQGPVRPDWAQVYADLANPQNIPIASQQSSDKSDHEFKIGECAFCEPDYRQILIWAKALASEPATVVQRLLESGTVFVNDYGILRGADPRYDAQVEQALAFASTLFHGGKRTAIEIWEAFKVKFGGAAEHYLKIFRSHRDEATPAERFAIDWDALYAQVLYERIAAEFKTGRERCAPLKMRELRWRFDLLAITTFEWVEGLDIWMCAEFSDRSGHRGRIDTLAPKLRAVRELVCCDLGLKELDLSGVPRLETLKCTGNEIERLDVSSLFRIETLQYDAAVTRLNQRDDQKF